MSVCGNWCAKLVISASYSSGGLLKDCPLLSASCFFWLFQFFSMGARKNSCKTRLGWRCRLILLCKLWKMCSKRISKFFSLLPLQNWIAQPVDWLLTFACSIQKVSKLRQAALNAEEPLFSKANLRVCLCLYFPLTLSGNFTQRTQSWPFLKVTCLQGR